MACHVHFWDVVTVDMASHVPTRVSLSQEKARPLKLNGSTCIHRTSRCGQIHVLSSTFLRHALANQLRTAPRERVLIEACLGARIRFVLDNTSPTRQVRAPLIAQMKNAGFRVHAFYFEPDFDASFERNARRKEQARVPFVALKSIAKTLQRPSFEEGFSSIFSVWNIGARGFEVKEWTNEI